MSRIGKKPIIIDQQINVQLDGQSLIISGPLGELSLVIPYQIEVINKNQSLLVQANSRDNKAICLTGTFRQIINNMVLGVTEGFKKSLELKGIGYRAFLEDGGLKLQLGFSHPIIFTPPSGIELKVEKILLLFRG
jgi:large subunit ribosomal protein L6